MEEFKRPLGCMSTPTLNSVYFPNFRILPKGVSSLSFCIQTNLAFKKSHLILWLLLNIYWAPIMCQTVFKLIWIAWIVCCPSKTKFCISRLVFVECIYDSKGFSFVVLVSQAETKGGTYHSIFLLFLWVLTSRKQWGSVLASRLTSPRMGSGLLTTADSRTAGCSASALSTSTGPIR